MDFPQSRAAVPVLEILDETGSTNDELVRRASGPAADEWPDLSVLVTQNQTAGRGRLGRQWSSPAGASLAVSVLLRPVLADGSALELERFGWFPLMAGLAMTRAVETVVPGTVALKWPNDVLISGNKVSGILAELLPGASAVVLGAGLNVTMTEQDLPTATSTSLTLSGAQGPDPDAILAAFLIELTELYRRFLVGTTQAAAELQSAVAARCETLGRAVRVELPSGARLLGTATALDATGRLLVETNTGITAVAAGDVTHLRY